MANAAGKTPPSSSDSSHLPIGQRLASSPEWARAHLFGKVAYWIEVQAIQAIRDTADHGGKGVRAVSAKAFWVACQPEHKPPRLRQKGLGHPSRATFWKDFGNLSKTKPAAHVRGAWRGVPVGPLIGRLIICAKPRDGGPAAAGVDYR
ncbi:hypothetical protein F1880_003352 [Penicillium rolfsii]|nr:hypothetical protein F1880_003352 [Penicillium rolfsii]